MMSGRVKSGAPEGARRILDRYALEGFAWPENFERLRRAEQLAEKKGVAVSQIAMSWIFRRGMNVFAVVSTSSPERLRQNAEATEIDLTEAECAWLDLEEA